MHAIEWILGIIILVCSLFLVVAVLFQQGKEKGLGGSISGGSETFFGKTKGKTIDKVLSKTTTVIAIVFVVLVVAAFIVDGNFSQSNINIVNGDSTTTVTDVTTEAPVETTAEATAPVQAPAEGGVNPVVIAVIAAVVVALIVVVAVVSKKKK